MMPKKLSKSSMRCSRKLRIEREKWLGATTLGSNNKLKHNQCLGIITKVCKKPEQKPQKPNWMLNKISRTSGLRLISGGAARRKQRNTCLAEVS